MMAMIFYYYIIWQTGGSRSEVFAFLLYILKHADDEKQAQRRANYRSA